MKASLVLWCIVIVQFCDDGYGFPQYGWYGGQSQSGYPSNPTSGGSLPAFSFPQGYSAYAYPQQGGLAQLPYYAQNGYGGRNGYNGYNGYSGYGSNGMYIPDSVVIDVQSLL